MDFASRIIPPAPPRQRYCTAKKSVSQSSMTWSNTRCHDALAADDPPLTSIRIYVDADACPVKDKNYRVAARQGKSISGVAGGYIRVPDDPLIERIAAGAGMD